MIKYLNTLVNCSVITEWVLFEKKNEMIVRQVWYLWDLFLSFIGSSLIFFCQNKDFFFLQVVLKKLNTSYQTHQILERSCYKYIIIPDVLNTLYLNIFYNNFLQSIHREIRHTWKMRIFDIFAFFQKYYNDTSKPWKRTKMWWE